MSRTLKTVVRAAIGSAAFIGAALATTSAMAAVEVLNFAGLDGAHQEQPLEYYNGGLGGLGSGPGPNYGISFGADTIVCSDINHGGCNTDMIPGGPGANILYFLSGPGDVMNVSGGFDTGFSFFYSAIGFTGTVTVYSGLDSTGSVLATLNLGLTPIAGPGCAAQYCPFSAAGVTFAGLAHSVNFSGTADYIAFADITLGSPDAGGSPIPEPANVALMLAGLGLLGVAGRRRGRA